MPDSNPPDEEPPDLPPEYAEAYRRGYQRAYQQGSAGIGGQPQTDQAGAQTVQPQTVQPEGERTTVFESLQGAFEPAPEWEQPPSHRDGRRRRPTWFVPALLLALGLVLVASAYGIGKVLSGRVGDSGPAKEPTGVVMGDGSTTDGPTPPDNENPEESRYHGTTEATAIGGAKASCQTADGVDSGGHTVSYAGSNIYDGDMTTAWRCDGSGTGVTLSIDLPAATEVGELGLVPGYAKTDAESGADRYAENNRITKVRWILGNGSRFVQTFDGSSDVRKMQTIRIPRTKTAKLVIQILSTTPGPRNTTAISEVRVGMTQG